MIEPDDLARWAELTAPDARKRVNREYEPTLPGWEPVRSGIVPSDSTRDEHWVLFERQTALVRVDVTECADWRDAQIRLSELANECMSREVSPTAGADAPMALGDVRFKVRTGDLLTAVSFASGNLCVSIATVSRFLVDVEDFARAIDGELRRPDAERTLEP